MNMYKEYTIPAATFVAGVGAAVGWRSAERFLFAKKVRKIFEEKKDDEHLVEALVDLLRQRHKKMDKDDARVWALAIVQVHNEDGDARLAERLATALDAARERISQKKKKAPKEGSAA